MELVKVPLIALISPLVLIPVEKVFPYPYLIEELVKMLFVSMIIDQEKGLKKSLTVLIFVSGFLFTLSESVFYLINIFELGDLTAIPKRLFMTGILHVGSIFLMYILSRKNKLGLLIGLIISILLHYFYNSYLAVLSY